ncbi:hypothetical protein Tco_0372494, partial [Tanacetum coccineum]
MKTTDIGSLDLIEEVIDPWEWIAILHLQLVQLPVNDPSFFLTNKTGAPQGEEL